MLGVTTAVAVAATPRAQAATALVSEQRFEAAASAATGSNVFNESVALSDLWLSQAVYADNTEALKSWTCGLACDKYSTSDRRVAEVAAQQLVALVARTSATACVVAFRGTKSAANVLQDVNFVPTPLPGCDGCMVHKGFYDDWRALEPQVTAHLDALGCGGSSSGGATTTRGSTALTGHSLGGAMATLHAFHLLKSTNGTSSSSAPFTRLYTYGEPRLGNPIFANTFDAMVKAHGVEQQRVVEYKDPVPHMPEQAGWQHTRNEVYYYATALGKYVTCADAADMRCSAQWNFMATFTHKCDHCSYLGMNPCSGGATVPECTEPGGGESMGKIASDVGKTIGKMLP